MQLIAFLGNDKENLGQITALVNRGEFEKIILVKDKATPEISTNKPYSTLEVNTGSDLISLKEEMKDKLKSHLLGELEVALSIASGSGKEHMALVSALLSVPVGIKLTAFTKDGIKFLT